jgi:uncharacterized metal-binding protein
MSNINIKGIEYLKIYNHVKPAKSGLKIFVLSGSNNRCITARHTLANRKAGQYFVEKFT